MHYLVPGPTPCPEVVTVSYVRPAEVLTLFSVEGEAQVERQNTIVGFLTIMLLIVFPKDFVGVQIHFDSECAPAACLLQWDRLFRLGNVLPILLPASEFSGAPIHVPLLPYR